MKKVIVNGIPRQAVLKPAHAVYRLQNQRFDVGDRVMMVQDSGSVPLSIKGVIIGINAKTLDVVWDVSLLSGSTLGNRYDPFRLLNWRNHRLTSRPRCSQYRGATVEFHSCLNLSDPQLVTSTNPSKPHQSHPTGSPHRGAVHRQPPQSVWKPPVNRGSDVSFTIHGTTSLIFLTVLHSPVHIMANPHRGGRSGSVNGRGGGTVMPRRDTEPFNHQANSTQESSVPSENVPGYRGYGWGSRGSSTRGGAVRGGNSNVLGGRGGFTGGRGGGGSRGRGRGQGPLWSSS